MKKVLIVAYTFPPTPGVGGRRWAKFAKYMYRKGYDVKIIAAKVPYIHESNWNNDIKELSVENRISYIDSGYPKYMYNPKTFFEKLMYSVSLIYLKLRVKGQYYDSSVLWEKHLMPSVERHINNGYRTIIATGGPFRYLIFLGKLKNKYDDVKLIADIRDPWTTNRTSFGYDSLSIDRYTFEKKSEQFVIQKFDTVITVHDNITSYFSKINNSSSCKFLTIKNGFDTDDMKIPEGYSKKKSEKQNFVFVGTFYLKALHILEEFMEALDIIEKKHKELYITLKFDFYGEVPKEFHNIIVRHSKIIEFYGKIPLSKVATTIYSSSGAMLFLTDDLNYSFSTKFYEYVSLRKPLLVFSKKGKTGEYTKDNRLGFMIPQGNMYKTLINSIRELSEGYSVDESFNLSPYSVEKLTDDMLNTIFL